MNGAASGSPVMMTGRAWLVMDPRGTVRQRRRCPPAHTWAIPGRSRAARRAGRPRGDPRTARRSGTGAASRGRPRRRHRWLARTAVVILGLILVGALAL